MEEILQLKDVTYHYQDGKSLNTILDQCSYTFKRNKIYAIVGVSGSGKTTTLILAGGLDKTKDGTILFKNKDIKKIGYGNYRQKDVSIVFQSYNLIYYMNALDNVINAINIAKMKAPNKKEYALNILKSLGLDEKQCHRDIRQLSGGQQQRVAIARAIAKDVDLILADEPTGNLDEKNSKDIMKEFVSLAHDKQKCVIVVTHSQKLANMCDVVLQIKDGKLIEV